MPIQQRDGFLCPGRTKPAQEKDGAEGAEQLGDLIGIGKSRNPADEDLPESRVEARGQKKREPAPELILVGELSLNRNP